MNNDRMICKAKRKTDNQWIVGFPTPRLTLDGMVMDLSVVDLEGMKIHTYEIIPETLCCFTGILIYENFTTERRPSSEVFDDDIIAIYSITYDDNDNLIREIREKVAEVQVKYDEEYGFAFAECILGTINDIAEKCDISYLNDDFDIPFSYFVETMSNESSQWWEWEIIGNKNDNN